MGLVASWSARPRVSLQKMLPVVYHWWRFSSMNNHPYESPKKKILESQPLSLITGGKNTQSKNRGWVKTEGRSCLKSIFFFAIEDVMLRDWVPSVIHTSFVSPCPWRPASWCVLSWLVQALLFETTNSWGVMWRHWPNSSSESTEKKTLDRLSLLTWSGHSDTYTHSTCRPRRDLLFEDDSRY